MIGITGSFSLCACASTAGSGWPVTSPFSSTWYQVGTRRSICEECAKKSRIEFAPLVR